MQVNDFIEAFSHLHSVQMTSPDHLEIVKESLDRRNKTRYVYTIIADMNDNISCDSLNKNNPGLHFKELSAFDLSEPIPKEKSLNNNKKICIVGSGPAGMFAAYSLMMHGFDVTLLERGDAIPDRHKKVKTLFAEGTLDEESNICFGEGGAGTFSDGKLTTRKKHPWIRWILSQFVSFGGPNEILTAGKPHIGSDRLRALTIQFRKFLIQNGVKILFNHHVNQINIENNKVHSISDGQNEFNCSDGLIWACGHSARDSYELLYEEGIPLEAKAFAVGVRIEHQQAFINEWKKIPSDSSTAADYSVVCNLDETNSVYSFCMCPGGQIVCSSSHSGFHVVNGMSNYKRNSEFANAGLVVKVSKEDFGDKTPFDGLNFQAKIEQKSFKATKGTYLAPAQKVTDFLENKISEELLPSSYQPGLIPCNFWEILPQKVCDNLKKALIQFDKKTPGFAGASAQFIGTETRTSAPIRIPRNNEGVVENILNFYPCGEGAGYAGGIISAALDGLNIANCLKIQHYGKE